MPDFRYCVGTFAKPLTSGIQTVPVADADGPFTPKAVIFFSSKTPGGFAAHGQWCTGWMDGVSMQATSTFKENDSNSRATRSFMTSLSCLAFATAFATTVNETATFNAFDLGSFGLAWNIDSGTGTEGDVNFLALGGDDITCVAGFVETPNATGAQIVSVPGAGVITGVLFANVLTSFSASVGVAGPWSDNVPMLGFAGIGQGAASTHVNNPQSFTRYSDRIQVTDAALINFGESTNPDVTARASLASLGTDQFTLDWSVENFPGFFGNTGTYYLAIAGPRVTVTSGTAPGIPGVQNVPLTGNCLAALVLSIGAPASALQQDSVGWSLGATDGISQAHAWLGDTADLNPSVASRSQAIDRVLQIATPALDPANVAVGGAAAATFVPGALRLTWSQVTGANEQFLVLAFEEGDVPPPGPEGCFAAADFGNAGLDVTSECAVGNTIGIVDPNNPTPIGSDLLMFALRPDSPSGVALWISSEDGVTFSPLALPYAGVNGLTTQRFTAYSAGRYFYWVSRGLAGTDEPMLLSFDGVTTRVVVAAFPAPTVDFPADTFQTVPQILVGDDGDVYCLVQYYTLVVGTPTGQGSIIYRVDAATGVISIAFDTLPLPSADWFNTLATTFLLPVGEQAVFPPTFPAIIGQSVNVGSATGIWEYAAPGVPIGAIIVPPSGLRSPGLAAGQFSVVNRWVRTLPAVNGITASLGAVQEMTRYGGVTFLATGGVTAANIAYVMRRSYTQDANTTGIWTGIDPSIQQATIANNVTHQGTILGARFSRFVEFNGSLFVHYRDTSGTGTSLYLRYVGTPQSDAWDEDVDLIATLGVASSDLPGQPVVFHSKLYVPMVTSTPNSGYLLIRDANGTWTRTLNGTGFQGPGGVSESPGTAGCEAANGFGCAF